METLTLRLCMLPLLLMTPTLVQGQATATCPVVSVDGPSTEVTQGDPLIFRAQLNANATARPTFRWETSAGTIVSGQGSSSIVIDTAGLGGQTITARVVVSGIATTCPNEASHSANVKVHIACALPFDDYGDIDFEDEKARLDNFSIQLMHSPDVIGYMLVYAGRRTYEGEAQEHLRRARHYMIEYRKISSDRLVFINGGYREELATTLMLAPKDAAPPEPMPLLSPHEIELTKPVPKSRRQRRN